MTIVIFPAETAEVRLWGDALFNLLFNALGAFWLALGLSLLLFRTFRLERSRLGLLVLLLPFVKLVVECARGVPRESFFWLSEQGVRQTLGSFRVGVGATALGPLFKAELWAQHPGGSSPQSAGDLATRALSMKFGANAAPLDAWALVAVALGFLLRLAYLRARGFAEVRALVRRATPRERRRAGGRVVRVLESGEASLPFAAGVVSPIILLPVRLSQALAPAELEAVIEHELAHVRRFDAPLLTLLDLLGCAFWYVPGVAMLVRRVAAHLERRADDAALRAGVPAPALARALLTAAELARGHAEPRPLLGMAGTESVLKSRLSRLLLAPAHEGTTGSARRSLLVSALKSSALVWCALSVLRAVAFGNHVP
jgi:beta-lactamase regulating signal transducer with metallopeptidase domain